MRYLAIVLMVGLAVATTILPGLEPRQPDPVPAAELPPVAICPLLEAGDRDTSISVLSSANAEGRLSTFSVGEETGATDFSTGTSGGVTLPAAEAGAVGSAGALVELPSDTTGSGVLIAGPNTSAAESCADIPAGQVFVSGGSTVTDSFFEVELINPYAGEATVQLTVSTDAGLESDERFDSVIVPALSTITLDLTQIIPGRESISVEVETLRGSVLAFGRQTTGGESALWRAVAPAQDWWLPVPPGGSVKRLIVATPESTEVDYQIDLYGPDGYVEAHATGLIGPRGSDRVGLATISDEAFGVRLIATAPVVPHLWMDSDEGMAATVASPVDAPTWLLPGASRPADGTGTLVLLNTGIETVDVAVTRMADEASSQAVDVGPEAVSIVELRRADGYRVEASGPVVALWTSTVDGAGTAALGIPFQDG